MRQFLIIGHEAPTHGDFPLDDLPGSAGRFDLLCRCVTAALLYSHGVRTNVRVHLVIQDEVTITIDGGTVRRLNPDERSTAARLQTALDHRDEAIGHQPVEPSPGVALRTRGLEPTLDDFDGTPVLLHPDGEKAPAVDVPSDPIFLLSDHHEFTAGERELLEDHAVRTVTLGPTPLHADQAITVAHNWLDTEGFMAYSDH